MATFAWDTWDRGSRTAQLGYIACRLCGTVWLLPKCRVRNPTLQTMRVLEMHRAGCQARPGGEDSQEPAGPKSGLPSFARLA